MKSRSLSGTASLAALGVVLMIGGGAAQHAGDHKLVPPQDMKWGPAPASVPAGAQAVVLYGDPGKDGMFAFRLKMPKDYHIPPHTHPKPEIVTVISGTARLGMGEAANRTNAQILPAGSFFALPPGSAHFFFADEDTVIQLNSTGPWGISYVNPKDDPRQKTQ
jgi:quercetin dioxygenase-like cupin family protein